jgi:hypothetical protein
MRNICKSHILRRTVTGHVFKGLSNKTNTGSDTDINQNLIFFRAKMNDQIDNITKKVGKGEGTKPCLLDTTRDPRQIRSLPENYERPCV